MTLIEQQKPSAVARKLNVSREFVYNCSKTFKLGLKPKK